MALTTRTVTNISDPILDQEGEIIPDLVVTFQLCDSQGLAVDAWDQFTNERVVSKVSSPVVTDGEFTVNLWPNDRGTETTYYRCATSSDSDTDRLVSVTSGAGDLLWKDIMLASLPVP